MLTLVQADPEYAVYEDDLGTQVRYDRDNPRDLDEMDLPSEWQAWLDYHGYVDDGWARRRFTRWLNEITVNARVVRFCEACNLLSRTDINDGLVAVNGGYACPSCVETYTTCEHCDGLFSLTYRTANGGLVCYDCRVNLYVYCDQCGAYRHAEVHCEHSRPCECEPPTREVTVHAKDGTEYVNEQRYAIELDGGYVDDVGMTGVRDYLQGLYRDKWTYPDDNQRYALFQLGALVYTLDPQWQTSRGNFAKRLSALAHKSGWKIPDEVISRVGDIARAHSNPVKVQVEFTRDLNQSAKFFYHGGSCWWTQGYTKSRCALKTNGGFGMRSFSDRGKVTGRAWVMPLKVDPFNRLKPTFDTTEPAAYLVFNGYGDLEGFTPARVMAHLTGWSYKKVPFIARPMYVNNDSAFLVGPGAIVKQYATDGIDWRLEQHANLYATEIGEPVHAHL